MLIEEEEFKVVAARQIGVICTQNRESSRVELREGS